MKKGLFILIILVIVTGGGWYYYKNKIPAGWTQYSNTTLGLEFIYPSDWKLQEYGDPQTHGDVMRDGKIYLSFTANITPPDFSQEFIVFAHSPLANAKGEGYDNLSISEQLNLLCAGRTDCPRKTNKNGVRYLKYDFSCSELCEEAVDIPTGKVVVGFSIEAALANSPQVAVFEKIVDSIKLK